MNKYIVIRGSVAVQISTAMDRETSTAIAVRGRSDDRKVILNPQNEYNFGIDIDTASLIAFTDYDATF